MKKTTLISIALSLCMLVSCLTACSAGTHQDAALDVRQNAAQTAEENPAGDPAKDMNEPEYRQALKLRQVWCEGAFAAQKWGHNLTRGLRRGLEAAEDHCLLSATALNVKRLIRCM